MDFAGLEKLSLVDYDHHIACTLFTRGCNFRCPFCHNGPLVVPGVDDEFIPWNDILSFLKKRKELLDAVVITGGEPTMMPDLVEKIKDIKEIGYLVKLDTNGTNPKMLKKLVEEKLIDFVAMDIKSSLDVYPSITDSNVNKDAIKESVNFLINGTIDYEFRTTLIAEYHTEEDIKKISELIKGAKKYRLQKFVDREGCISHDLNEVKKEDAEKFIPLLNKNIKDVALRGY